jgi:hypothetical protein
MTLNKIIEKNITLMRSYEEGGMLSLEESIGGNAGTWMDLPCYGARFYYNDNGEIIRFGNIQNVPKEIRENYKEGIFHIAINMVKKGDRIIDVLDVKNSFARTVLILTKNKYNQRFGF